MYYDRPQKKKHRPPTEPETRTRPRRRASLFRILFTTPHREERDEEPMETRKRRPSMREILFETPERDEPETLSDAPASEVEERPARRGRHVLLKLVLAALALMVACALALYALPVGLFGSHSKADYLANNKLPSGYTHVLLLGVDRDANGTSRSDTIMVVSVGKGSVKLTSLQRDTGVTVPGKSGTHRLNAAYAYGGAELALKTVNQNFGLNITRYAVVDYDGFEELIDRIGGVRISVTDAEAEQINKNMFEVINTRYKRGLLTYDGAWEIYNREKLAAGGEDLPLSGLQALGYARIRKLDSDYGRTNRQRRVISAAIAALKENLTRPATLLHVASGAISMLDTNMNAAELLSLGEKALLAAQIDQTRLPKNGTYTDSGGMFYDVDYSANHDAFVEFVYGG